MATKKIECFVGKTKHEIEQAQGIICDAFDLCAGNDMSREEVFSTMDELKQLNWDRISGSINCPKCGHYSNIYIPKDDEERTNYCQFLTPPTKP